VCSSRAPWSKGWSVEGSYPLSFRSGLTSKVFFSLELQNGIPNRTEPIRVRRGHIGKREIGSIFPSSEQRKSFVSPATFFFFRWQIRLPGFFLFSSREKLNRNVLFSFTPV
jgi:hypothetical protein